jgi:excisionase family DNA binding protein
MSAEVLSTDEAAELLSMHPKTLLRHAREGAVPAARVGRRWKFSRRQLLAWVEEGGERYERLVDEGLKRAAEEAAVAVAEGRSKLVPMAEARKRLGL